MKKNSWLILAAVVLGVGLLWIYRAGQPSGDADERVPNTPKEAAAQVEQVFQESAPEVKQAATSAADAMRTGDYEKAVVSLTVVRQNQNLTLQQGMAVYNSMVNLESQLIKAMEAGDPNAKRAYDILRKSKQK